VGTRSNRDGIGAVVRVTTAGGRQWQMVKSGSSYCSQSDLALTFGLGREHRVATLGIDWPSGGKQVLRDLPADRFVTVVEGRGISAENGPAKAR
jgi:enediyne biosynthesis protein E4